MPDDQDITSVITGHKLFQVALVIKYIAFRQSHKMNEAAHTIVVYQETVAVLLALLEIRKPLQGAMTSAEHEAIKSRFEDQVVDRFAATSEIAATNIGKRFLERFQVDTMAPVSKEIEETKKILVSKHLGVE